MNNKWIVPIVAILLCAVSLIGAGYAAFTATLQDSESVTTEVNYVTLDIGTTSYDRDIDIVYDSDFRYVNGVLDTTYNTTGEKYVPYLATAGTNAAITSSIEILQFDVSAAVDSSESSSTSYALTLSSVSVSTGAPIAAANLVLKAYSDAEHTQEISNGSSVNYDDTVYLVLSYAQDGTLDVKNTDDGITDFTISYTITAEAIIEAN